MNKAQIHVNIIIIVLLLLLQTTSKAQQLIDIQLVDCELTMELRNAPLLKVLENLADQTQMKFVSYVDLDENISISKYGLPLIKGLEKILKGYNYTMISRETVGCDEALTIIIYSNNGARPLAINSKTRNSYEKPLDYDRSYDDDYFNFDQFMSATVDERINFVSELTNIPPKKSLLIFDQILKIDNNDDVKIAVIEEIGDLQHEDGIELLSKYLKDQDENIREAVITSLAGFDSDNVLPELEKALSDESENIRDQAKFFIDEIKND